MKQVIIENPVINSPYDEPKRHFKFTEEGITDEIIEGTRRFSKAGAPNIEEAYATHFLKPKEGE